MNPQVKQKPGLAQTPKRQADPIIGELWEIKRAINREAGYDIPALVKKAREAAHAFDETTDHSNSH